MKLEGCFNCGARYGNMCRLENPQRDIEELDFCPNGFCEIPELSPAEITKLREESDKMLKMACDECNRQVKRAQTAEYEYAELKERYDKLVKDWAKSRAEVFQEQYAVFKKTCDDCKDGTAAKSAQAAYEKQLKWKEDAQAECEQLRTENKRLEIESADKERAYLEEFNLCKETVCENKRLKKALELAVYLANWDTSIVGLERLLVNETFWERNTTINESQARLIQAIKTQAAAAEADKKGE